VLGKPTLANYAYTLGAAGNLSWYTYSNAVQTSKVFDPLNRLVQTSTGGYSNSNSAAHYFGNRWFLSANTLRVTRLALGARYLLTVSGLRPPSA